MISGSPGILQRTIIKDFYKKYAFWQVVRTAEQIRLSMPNRLAGNEPGLAGYWRLDEVDHALIPSDIPDRTYLQNHLTAGGERETYQPQQIVHEEVLLPQPVAESAKSTDGMIQRIICLF